MKLVWTGLVSQTGTSAPTAVVLENTLGGEVAWSYEDEGFFKGFLQDGFPDGATVMFVQQTLQAPIIASSYGGGSEVYLRPDQDGVMFNVAVHIEVFIAE